MRRKRTVSIFAILCSIVMILTGCQIGNRDIIVSGTLGSRQVFKIEGTACGLKEAGVYLTNYQNIYGTAYGTNLWEHNFGDDSLSDYVKDVTLETLTRVVCMNLLAKSQGMELSKEELKNVAGAAKEYYASLSEEEVSYMAVTESDIQDYYERYALAKKLYNSLTDGVNEEVSDDEARVMEIMQIFVTDRVKAMEVQTRLSSGDDFAAVANNYNEWKVIQVTISRENLPKEVEEIVFQMDNNEISDMISTGDGYYFIKCLNKYNEELTEANKANIVQKREEEAFDNVYHEFVSRLTANMNEKLWDSLVLDTKAGVTTNSFFEVFEKNCGDI